MNGNAVDAISLAGILWTVIKHMSKMCVTNFASDLSALSAEGMIRNADYIFIAIDRFGESRPSAARVEFAIRQKQFSSTASAYVFTGRKVLIKFPSEGRLCSRLTAYIVLLWRKNLFPFGVRDFLQILFNFRGELLDSWLSGIAG